MAFYSLKRASYFGSAKFKDALLVKVNNAKIYQYLLDIPYVTDNFFDTLLN